MNASREGYIGWHDGVRGQRSERPAPPRARPARGPGRAWQSRRRSDRAPGGDRTLPPGPRRSKSLCGCRRVRVPPGARLGKGGLSGGRSLLRALGVLDHLVAARTMGHDRRHQARSLLGRPRQTPAARPLPRSLRNRALRRLERSTRRPHCRSPSRSLGVARRRSRDVALRGELACRLRAPVVLCPIRGSVTPRAHLVLGHRGAVLPGMASGLAPDPHELAASLAAGRRRCHRGRGGRLGGTHGPPLPPRRRSFTGLLRHRHAPFSTFSPVPSWRRWPPPSPSPGHGSGDRCTLQLPLRRSCWESSGCWLARPAECPRPSCSTADSSCARLWPHW